MYSSYFARFFLFISILFGSPCLAEEAFPKGFPSKDSIWPSLWVQDSARIRPVESAALKWWTGLDTSLSSKAWSQKELGASLEPWQLWIGLYFCEKEQRKAFRLICLDSLMAQSLHLNPKALYSLNEIEAAQKKSPDWNQFAQQVVLEAFISEKKVATRFQSSSKRALTSIDPTLNVYLDAEELKVFQGASHPFLKQIPSTLSIQSIASQPSKELHLKAWQNFVDRCAKIGVSSEPNTGLSLLKLPLLVDSVKSTRWHEPAEIFLNEKSILGVSKPQWQELFLLWNKEPAKAWDLLASYIQTSQELLAKQSPKKTPSKLANFLERLYFKLPLLSLIALGYFLAAFAKYKRLNKLFSLSCFLSWILHSALLLIRVIILERPPVSNMEETAIYVPWIAATVAIILGLTKRTRSLSAETSPFTAIYGVCGALVGAIVLFGAEPGLEVVPAVLNSQFWLTIHVLMVVASYAFFLAASAVSHTQILNIWKKRPTQHVPLVIGSMALGTLLLTCGTLLGAVWAAQSWGRFWDWDPKESWAFISCCLYLLIFHAWAFKKITPETLHLFSIIGFWVISFTWYGVNFVIATGLHSYGFGASPYTWLYLALLFLDAVVLAMTFMKRLSHQ